MEEVKVFELSRYEIEEMIKEKVEFSGDYKAVNFNFIWTSIKGRKKLNGVKVKVEEVKNVK